MESALGVFLMITSWAKDVSLSLGDADAFPKISGSQAPVEVIEGEDFLIFILQTDCDVPDSRKLTLVLNARGGLVPYLKESDASLSQFGQ